MSAVKFCPFCGRTDKVRYADETAFVTFSEFNPDEIESEPEADAIYCFDCCNKAVAVLFARPQRATEGS